jgi:glycosyltransferase involved in cell wall biosynthesis
VLCLHGLTARELAACYRLAELAVNPSLSEGGCPFTLTEALSVGTPVVMGRIAVTEEVITDPALQDVMLFDPYDWKDMAARIEWALQNREALLTRQLKFYAKLSQRTWRHVVDEHIAILDRISEATPVPEVRS